MDRNLIALFAATMASASMATVGITGTYEGTLQDGNPGAATYTQDLDLTIKGQSVDTTVTATLEDLTGGAAVTATQVYIETTLATGVDFKGGSYKGQNGLGLMQAESSVTNQMEVAFGIDEFGITLGQVSGDGNATVDVAASIANVDVTVQNASASDRFISAIAEFFGFNVTAEYQKTAVGTNIGGTLNRTIGGVDLTTVVIDANDTSVITQDDGIIGDISGVNNGDTIVGGIAAIPTTFGTVTGKMYDVNDATTYVGELQAGVMTYSYTKADATNGVLTAELNVAF